jgi:SAM-dependent methyltransferase
LSGTAAIWHDVECGSYQADLPLWEELAEKCGSPIVELGCGTGRVALHLARRGHPVYGVERDRALIEVLIERGEGLPVKPLHLDALDLELDEQVPLVLAPMQFLQLFKSQEARLRCLHRAGACLQPDGVLAVALLERLPERGGWPPLPDMREIDGWVYSSQPTGVAVVGSSLTLPRRRKVIAPDGTISEDADKIELQILEIDEFEAEAEAAGFTAAAHAVIPPTEEHMGSHVLLLESSD